MKNIKVILSTILILIINLFVGCSNINEKKEEKLDLFDVFKGKDLAINYLINIRNGDISSAVNNCESEILESNINLSEGVSNITGFQLNRAIANSQFAYYIFNVIRDSNIEPKSDLEEYIIKDFARRIAKVGEITSSAEWQALRAKEIGISTKYIKGK